MDIIELNAKERGYILYKVLDFTKFVLKVHDVDFLDIHLYMGFDPDDDVTVNHMLERLRKESTVNLNYVKQLNLGWWRNLKQ